MKNKVKKRLILLRATAHVFYVIIIWVTLANKAFASDDDINQSIDKASSNSTIYEQQVQEQVNISNIRAKLYEKQVQQQIKNSTGKNQNDDFKELDKVKILKAHGIKNQAIYQCGLEESKAKEDINEEESKKNTSKIRIFMSLSVPRNIWQILSKELEQEGGEFVLRGVPKNDFKELAKILLKLREDRINANILIDPKSFKENNITQVPSFLIEDKKGDLHKIIGNISVKEALRQIETIK
jgi:type-F conjugative transfer system pilin assembly protein TrbC